MLIENKVKFTGERHSFAPPAMNLLFYALPLLLIGGGIYFMRQKHQGANAARSCQSPVHTVTPGEV